MYNKIMERLTSVEFLDLVHLTHRQTIDEPREKGLHLTAVITGTHP